MSDFDIIIIGAGIAGASSAAFVSPDAHVLILEAETQAGYHTTGRSAAFYSESYGGAEVQPLSLASKPFLFEPPKGFVDIPLVRPRGALHVARAEQALQLDRLLQDYGPLAPALHKVGKAEISHLAPMLRPAWSCFGVYDPDCQDMDVAALHQGLLRQAYRHGATLITDAQVVALQREDGRWRVTTKGASFTAAAVVNAAGAWGDSIAKLANVAPIGLQPRLRTIIAFTPTGFPVAENAPLVLDIDAQFYFKPDGAQIWASPSDETPVSAADVQADEYTVAVTAHRIESATRYGISHIARRWAGLRTFAPDRVPVYGFDPAAPGFFWCVGQGGFGIQTAVAAGMLCAAQLAGRAMPDIFASLDITPQRYAVERLRSRA